MTPEEKKQFEEWQLKTENRMNFLVEQQAQFFADLEALKVAQAESSKQQAETNKQIDKLIQIQIEMREQAEIDRQEVREAVDKMLTIAEAMQTAVIGLAQAQQGNSQRIVLVERRLDRLETPSS